MASSYKKYLSERRPKSFIKAYSRVSDSLSWEVTNSWDNSSCSRFLYSRWIGGRADEEWEYGDWCLGHWALRVAWSSRKIKEFKRRIFPELYL